jgi:uncharacterized protein (DUF1330 family)
MRATVLRIISTPTKMSYLSRQLAVKRTVSQITHQWGARETIGSISMKTHHAVALAMVAGILIGGLVVQGIHAQARPPAYYVAEIDVANEDIYNKQWAPKAEETVKAAGGTYLVRSTDVERIEGAAPKRLLISKWDNIDKLTAWRESQAYMRTLPILDKAIKSVRSYAVEGVN